jgi:hypothetical protein
MMPLIHRIWNPDNRYLGAMEMRVAVMMLLVGYAMMMLLVGYAMMMPII